RNGEAEDPLRQTRGFVSTRGNRVRGTRRCVAAAELRAGASGDGRWDGGRIWSRASKRRTRGSACEAQSPDYPIQKSPNPVAGSKDPACSSDLWRVQSKVSNL